MRTLPADASAASSAPRSVALIVVTYRSSDFLPGFLDSLHGGLNGVREAQVVVVDNASDDDTLAVATASPVVDHVVLMSHNGGYAAGINAGVAACPDRDAYLVLNPDVRLWPGCVSQLLAVLAAAEVGMVVPRLLDEHGALLTSLRREPSLLRAAGEAVLGGPRAGRWSHLGEVIVDPAVYDRATTAVWATGGVMLLSASCLDAAGPWDESFFLYEEEVEFALRARDRGFCLMYEPGATATRITGDDPPSPSTWTLMRLNKLRLYTRRHGRVRTAAFRFVLIIGEALRALAGRPASAAATRALLSSTSGLECARSTAPQR